MSVYSRMMSVCGAILIANGLRAAPPEKPVDAAALVREVREAEAWVDTVKSFSFTIERGAKAESNYVIARDENRFYFHDEWNQDIQQSTWDGKERVGHTKYVRKERTQEQYQLAKEPGGAESFVVHLPVPRAGPHKSKWGEVVHYSPDTRYGGDPEDYQLTGREKFRGVECYVLESEIGYKTLYVGVADHRLYGMATRVQTRFSMNSRIPVAMQVAREMGREVKNEKELEGWRRALPPQDLKHYEKETARQLRPWSRPYLTNWYEDYKEVAAGCWLPMHQGTDRWNNDADLTEEPKVTRSSDIRVTKATVNQPLQDDWFKWEFTEGVEVVDMRSDPVLWYKYKKHFEPAEWEAIVEEAHQQKIRRQPDSTKLGVHNDALGRAAPQFPPDAEWINSQPIKIADLKGKVVIVECWASWSKYCWEDMAKMNKQFESGDKDVVVISIHAAGTPVEELRQWVKEHGIKYPVCVDSPGNKGPWNGALFSAYHVIEVPTAYVITQNGTVKSWSDSFDAGVKIVRQVTTAAPAK